MGFRRRQALTQRPNLNGNPTVDQHPGKFVLVVMQMDNPAAGDRRELARYRVVGRPWNLIVQTKFLHSPLSIQVRTRRSNRSG